MSRGECRIVHHRVDLFRVQPLAHRGGIDYIDEQYRYLLQLLVRGGFAGMCRCQRATHRGECGFDYRVAEKRALRFQRGDGGYESLPFLGHAEQDTNSTWAAGQRLFDGPAADEWLLL